MLALGLVVAAVVVAVLVFLANRTHRGTASAAAASTHAQAHQDRLCDSCAHDYNPDALSGPKNQHPGQVGLAIDGNRNTAWSTESYLGDSQGKPGVGIYVDAKPGVAARSMILDTATPGLRGHDLCDKLAAGSQHVRLRARRLGEGGRRAERRGPRRRSS